MEMVMNPGQEGCVTTRFLFQPSLSGWPTADPPPVDDPKSHRREISDQALNWRVRRIETSARSTTAHDYGAAQGNSRSRLGNADLGLNRLESFTTDLEVPAGSVGERACRARLFRFRDGAEVRLRECAPATGGEDKNRSKE
jgi:hypothetical protein